MEYGKRLAYYSPVRRRKFLGLAAAAASLPASARLTVPIYRIFDARLPKESAAKTRFQATIWPEAVANLRSGGVDLQITEGAGELKYTAAKRPILEGARRGAINLFVTDHVPMYWDHGREWAGVTTILDGCHVCLVALREAHGNQAPFVSTNTCVHELLHALLQDVYLPVPRWRQSAARELRVDWYATRLWLFHEGTAIRQSAADYLRRLPRA